MRDHSPVIIDKIQGLWDRGSDDSCPMDHLTECNNIDFSEDNIITRARFTDFAEGGTYVRQYLFNTVITGTPTTFVLSMTTGGVLKSVQISPTIGGTVTLLTIPRAKDFAFVNINGRAYISPSDGRLGLSDSAATVPEFTYVYDGVNIYLCDNELLATGGPLLAANSATAGNVEAGLHNFSVIGETANGSFTSYPVKATGNVIATGVFKIDLTQILTGGARSYTLAQPIVKRHIIATKIISPAFVGAISSIPHYLVPGGTINDDTTTTLTVNFYDSELVDDISYLLGIDQTVIPPGVGLGIYHNRMISWGFADVAANDYGPNSIRVSFVNDPQAIDLVDGLISVEASSKTPILDQSGVTLQVGVTACQEYRDSLYVFKINKCGAFNDNGDVPANWPGAILDEGLGAFVHGIIAVLDRGGTSVDQLIIANKSGLYSFNGFYNRPELSWKVESLWKSIQKTYDITAPLQAAMHFANDTLNKKIYITLAYGTGTVPAEILVADYNNTILNDPSANLKIRFSRWPSSNQLSTILVYDDGVSSVVLANSVSGARILKFNGSAVNKETAYTSYVQTALIGDEEGNIIHIGIFRFRIAGDGSNVQTITPVIYNEDLSRSNTLANLSLPLVQGYEPQILANYVGQRAMLRLTTSSGGYMNINRIVAYIKAMFSLLPG